MRAKAKADLPARLSPITKSTPCGLRRRPIVVTVGFVSTALAICSLCLVRQTASFFVQVGLTYTSFLMAGTTRCPPPIDLPV